MSTCVDVSGPTIVPETPPVENHSKSKVCVSQTQVKTTQLCSAIPSFYFILFSISVTFFPSTTSRVRRQWRTASRGRSRHFILHSRAQRHPSFRRYVGTFSILHSMSFLEYTIGKCTVNLVGVRAGICQTNKGPMRLSADVNCCSVPTQTEFSSPVN